MVKQLYPRLEINLQYLRENVEQMVKRAEERGIEIIGVVKGTTGLVPCVQQFLAGGCTKLASSRLEQIEDCQTAGPEVIRLCDYSLNSEIRVLRALNEEAGRQGKIHRPIIMADLGDLREGYWDHDEMVDVCCQVENEMDNLELAGVGVNLGCYGSILATADKLQELVDIARRVEERIGRKLEYVSGGATSSLMRILDGDMPEGVNMLRCGEGILLSQDLDRFYGYDVSYMHEDVYTLKAEVIEVKTKPTHPVGTITVDAFGHKPVYEDRGMRRRALLGIGNVDCGNYQELTPRDAGIDMVGASSDHTIIDVEDAERSVEVGDILSFDVDYASLCYLTNCRNVHIVYV